MDKKLGIISYALAVMSAVCFIGGFAVLSGRGYEYEN